MEFGIEIFILLFIVGLLAGTMDTIAGGGGLLTLPALLSVGITPIEALGTNKLQSVFRITSYNVCYTKLLRYITLVSRIMQISITELEFAF